MANVSLLLIIKFLLLSQLALKRAECEIIIPDRSLQPLNFKEAIEAINSKMALVSSLKRSQEFSLSENNSNGRAFIVDTVSRVVESAKSTNSIAESPNVTVECLEQLIMFQKALLERQEWAITVLDAFGKPVSGIKKGALAWLGEYNECVNVTQPDWRGKYCLVGKPVSVLNDPASLSLKYGTCMPHKCSNIDIAEIINFAIKNITSMIPFPLPFNVSYVNATYLTCQEERSLDGPAILALVLIGIVISLVIVASLYDIFKSLRSYLHQNFIRDASILISDNKKDPEIDEDSKQLPIFDEKNEPKILKILMCFSAYTNTIKLFKINKNDKQLDCIHAIRFLSIAWVILGHTYAFSLVYSDNIVQFLDWSKRFSFSIVTGGFFAVDSFFLLSGMLTAYIFMKEVAHVKQITVSLMVKYYVHRFWRLTPAYMMVILISACLTKYMGSGPLFPTEGIDTFCKDNWWANLLYVNNIVNSNKMCFGVSWYLANDMQFHWIAPIMLIPLALGEIRPQNDRFNFILKLVGVFVSAVLIFTTIITTGLLVNHYPGSEYGIVGNPNFFDKIYIRPWCRIGPFVVGILLGYLIHLHKSKFNFKLRTDVSILGWLISFVIMGLLIFGLYGDVSGHPSSRFAHILYQATSRTAWGLALAYLIFACIINSGGFINKLLSFSFWTPLSRLSFSAYLIHMMVILIYHANQDHTYHYQDSGIAYTFVAHVSFSFVAAYFVSIAFEIPLLGLEKFIFKR